MFQRAMTVSGGGGKFYTETLLVGATKTVTLDFECKTIIATDDLNTSNGYSALWSDHVSSLGTNNFLYTNNVSSNAGYATISSGNRIESISADRKTIGIAATTNTSATKTTFWFYGDE